MNPKTKAFESFIEEQLENFPGVSFRKMFGGYGVYADEVFFGLIHGEKLYFHTSAESREKYEARGKTCFQTPGSRKSIKRYFEVPIEIVESRTALLTWAREALGTVASRED